MVAAYYTEEEAPATDMQAYWLEDMPDELADGEDTGSHVPHRLVGCSGDVLDATKHCASEQTHSAADIVHYRAMAHQVKVLQC